MDITFQTTPGGAQAAITAVPDVVDTTPVVAEDDPRVVALRAAATALLPAAGVADTDTVEVSLAMSDDPGWAVIRVGLLVTEG